MKTLLALLLGCCFAAVQARLVASVPLRGDLVERLTGAKGQFAGDAGWARLDGATVALFGGHNGGVLFQDTAPFGMGRSYSVFARVYARRRPEGGTSPAGQIVFRGDDRNGLDNYSLNLGNDGFYTFYFNSADNDGSGIRAPGRVEMWEALLATFDSRSGLQRLFIDGVLAAQTWTPILPISQLDKGCAPGFSIGNVQNPLGGAHNQPFNGSIQDVRLWDTAVSWDEAVRPVSAR